MLRTKLAAVASSPASLAEQVALLARHHGADPDRLWAIVAARRPRHRHRATRPALLHDPLPVKATTAMRLAADPLDDIWASAGQPDGGVG